MSVGALHEIVTCPAPGEVETEVGAAGVDRMANEMLDAEADEKPPDSAIAAEIVHVPVLTNATKPDVALIVHVDGVVDVKVSVPMPLPALAVAVSVGAVDAVRP